MAGKKDRTARGRKREVKSGENPDQEQPQENADASAKEPSRETAEEAGESSLSSEKFSAEDEKDTLIRKRTAAIKKTSVVGILGNGALAALKVTTGFITGSFALVSDGIDSSTDVLTSLVTYITAGISAQPPDEGHPYGHGRAETVATKLVAFIIFFAGSQLIVSAVRKLFTGELQSVPGIAALYAAGISIAGKAALGIYKYRIGRKYQSPMILADAVNMRNDVLISLSVLAGIFFTRFWNLPVLDTIVAIAVGLWILAGALRIYLDTSNELMDGIKDPKIYKRVFAAAQEVDGAGNPHKMRIRKLNNLFIVDMDIEVDEKLTVRGGHEIARAVEASIRKNVRNVYDVQVHVEPEGNIESEETYGLSEKSLS